MVDFVALLLDLLTPLRFVSAALIVREGFAVDFSLTWFGSCSHYEYACSLPHPSVESLTASPDSWLLYSC